MQKILVFFTLLLFSSEVFAQNFVVPKLQDLPQDYSDKNLSYSLINPAESSQENNNINPNNSVKSKPENPRSPLFEPQKQTPNRIFSANLSKPDIFINSNNLIKKTGSFYQARGEIITLQGQVMDTFGVPISGALIEIWQTNSAGKYQNLLEKNSKFLDIHFNMSGRAITDNLGRYNFLTIMPGSYLDRAPHINMNITHKDFGKIETEIYFENHPQNEFDYEYLSYNKYEKKALTARVKLSDRFDQNSYKRVYFDIIMDGVHKYKSFGGAI